MLKLKLFMSILASLASLVIATADDATSFNVHTNDPDLVANINIRSFHDFANSPEGKNISADGSGLKLGGIYRHPKGDSVKRSDLELDQDLTPFNETAIKTSVPNEFLQCLPTLCNTHRDVKFNNEDIGKWLYSQFGGFLGNMIGQPSYGDGISAVFNNVVCDLGVACSIWMGVSVWVVPKTDLYLGALVSIGPQELLATQIACRANMMGGETFCDVIHSNAVPNPGMLSYWWKPFKGATWGYPCPNTDQWTDLKCGHYSCDWHGQCKQSS